MKVARMLLCLGVLAVAFYGRSALASTSSVVVSGSGCCNFSFDCDDHQACIVDATNPCSDTAWGTCQGPPYVPSLH